MDAQPHLIVGKVSGVFGIKGAVKIYSYTEPRENILNYPNWLLRKNEQNQTLKLKSGQFHAKGVIAFLDGIVDRDEAALLVGSDILIQRSQLPPVEADEYYWADLEGLNVFTSLDVNLGVVDYLMETGANDVLVIKGDRERLVPFLLGKTVLSVDLHSKKIVVDWDPDF